MAKLYTVELIKNRRIEQVFVHPCDPDTFVILKRDLTFGGFLEKEDFVFIEDEIKYQRKDDRR